MKAGKGSKKCIARWVLTAIALCTIMTVVVGVALKVFEKQYEYTDFQADYVTPNLEVGTALRVDGKWGIFGDARRYVIMVRSSANKSIVGVPYVGPAMYPDAPARPRFVRTDKDVVIYHTEDVGAFRFDIGQFEQ